MGIDWFLSSGIFPCLYLSSLLPSLPFPLPLLAPVIVNFSTMAPGSVLASAVCLGWVRRSVWWCTVGVADLPKGHSWLGKEARWVESQWLGGWSLSGGCGLNSWFLMVIGRGKQ